jgi:hypothetical protein
MAGRTFLGRVTGAALAALLVTSAVVAQTPVPAPQARPARTQRPSSPAPRWPDGTINLGAPPGQSGKWEGGEPLVTDPNNYETRLGRAERRGRVHIDDVPIQAWAKALLKDRNDRFLADEPYTRCKPSPAARSVGTAYGIELLNLPGTGHIYLFQTGGAHSFRTFYVDGRPHPAKVEKSYFGHSIGHWEGDTLVVDTVGFSEGAWMDRFGLPHTDRLHTIERFTRLDSNTLDYTITIDDPGAYTALWTSGYLKTWEEGTDLFEYVCQENNFGPQLMIGLGESKRDDGSLFYVP